MRLSFIGIPGPLEKTAARVSAGACKSCPNPLFCVLKPLFEVECRPLIFRLHRFERQDLAITERESNADAHGPVETRNNRPARKGP